MEAPVGNFSQALKSQFTLLLLALLWRPDPKRIAALILILLPSVLFAAPSLQVSAFPDRSAPISLSSAELADNAYIFTAPDTGVSQVEFYLDAAPPGAPRQTERVPPYDFNGTAPDWTAYPFDTNSITDGQHTIYARVTYAGGTVEVLSAAFDVNNSVPKLSFSKNTLNFVAPVGSTTAQSASVVIDTTSGEPADFSISDNASWLSVSPTSGTSPVTLNVTVSPDGLTEGSYLGIVKALGNNVTGDALEVSLEVTSVASNDYDIFVSSNPDRSSATPLQGAEVSGNIYGFVPDDQSINRVNFYVNNPSKSGSPNQSEGISPYDLAGTGPNDLALPFDTTKLSDGDNAITAVVFAKDGSTHETTVFFSVVNDSPALSFSQNSLAGSVNINNPDAIQQTVSLSFSDGSGAPFTLTSSAAWLSGTADSGTTDAQVTVIADPTDLAAGSYTATLTAEATGYKSDDLVFSLTVNDNADGLVASPSNLYFSGAPDQIIDSKTVTIEHSAGESHAFTVSTNMPWLSASPASGNTPEAIQVSPDSSGMAAGNYSATVTITATGLPSLDIPVNLTLSSTDKCAPIVCSDVRVSLPYQLTFTEGQGYLVDKNGRGTGFTWIDKPSSGVGYIADNLEMNFLEGVLLLTTTPGIQYLSNNSLDNGLGVGFAAPNQITQISAQILDVPAGTGNYEQAGLWFGNNQDNYIKLVVLSDPKGPRIHYLMEVGGQTAAEKNIAVSNLIGSNVTFVMVVDPYSQTVDLKYQLDGSASVKVATLTPPEEFFSFDAAGIDPEIGTRSFAGIFGTHRNASAPIVYRFDDFTLEAVEATSSPDSSVEFLRQSYPLDYPTSMVWGPDNRLYVTQLFGSITAYTFDADYNIVDTQTIDSLQSALGPRLTLGITVSPDSTASNIELWVAHSSPSVDDGEPNSGMVTRLYGQGFTQVENVITGLPRAKANHSINSLHFGSDNRLYIAIAGNTGAGAPNDSNSEFGTRAEQPLSAAILVADVFAAGFDGTCANTSDMYGPPPCDVTTYATGLRNSYDFVFHSNGNIYATDNGLGVTGTYPPSPEPPCFGFGSTASYLNGGNNPGEQPDLLHLIRNGAYYGHPNPYRDECVFKDGSYQGVAPLPNYEAPFFILGVHKSSNAIIEYKGGTGCVGDFLNKQLLITDYSIGDDIYRVLLAQDGLSAIEGAPLISGFNDPLPLASSPDGVLFVGEFGGGKLTVLKPISLGCWASLSPSPIPLMDSSAASINGKIYVVGGKNSSGHLSTLWIYDPANDSWNQGSDVPGPAMENPAVVEQNGQLYVFGGLTDAYSGALNNAAVYHPDLDGWTALSPMPTPRGGATAQSLNGLIYVVGGMNSDGASLATVEAYDPQTDSWQSVNPMQVRRDNPGSAVLEGGLYVFGGRERNSDGTTTNGTLTSVEVYSPTDGSWQTRAPMPTGRRAMSVGTIGGKAQVVGGEESTSSPSGVFEQNEEYDPVSNSWRSLAKSPTPKHGGASATTDGKLYIIGGGTTTGSSYTASTEVFQF